MSSSLWHSKGFASSESPSVLFAASKYHDQCHNNQRNRQTFTKIPYAQSVHLTENIFLSLIIEHWGKTASACNVVRCMWNNALSYLQADCVLCSRATLCCCAFNHETHTFIALTQHLSLFIFSLFFLSSRFQCAGCLSTPSNVVNRKKFVFDRWLNYLQLLQTRWVFESGHFQSKLLTAWIYCFSVFHIVKSFVGGKFICSTWKLIIYERREVTKWEWDGQLNGG